MIPFTTDWNRLISTYSYVAGGIRMTRLIHVLCACGLLQGSHGGAVLFDHVSHSPLTLTHLIHEYHVDIPHGFRGATLVAKYEEYDVLFIKYCIVV
jgi:hypothetical protein